MTVRNYRLAFALLATASLVGAHGAFAATTVIGDFETGADGWFDWGYTNPPDPNYAANAPIGGTRYAFNAIGATHGSQAMQFSMPTSAYTQWASIKLQLGNGDPPSADNGWANGVDEWRDDFMAASQLAFDVTMVQSEMSTDPGNNFAYIRLTLNAQDWGFVRLHDESVPDPDAISGNEDGFITGSTFNPLNLVGTRTFTYTYDITHTHDGILDNPGDIPENPNYIELIYEMYTNGGVVFHMDNVRLIAPEPLTADFNGIAGVNGADLTILETNFGATGQTSNVNGDADGNTFVDGGDVLLWQRQNGSTGVVAAVGAIPEPTGALLAAVALGATAVGARKRR